MRSKQIEVLTLRSKGFVHLLQNDFDNAADAFQQALKVGADPLVSEYLNRANTCRSNPTNQVACSFSSAQFRPIFAQIFPIRRVYRCKDYPVLSVVDHLSQSVCQP